MRGIALCGGQGSRLKPLTDVTNKHLLPVYDKPMVFYPLQTLLKAGIDEIMVVVGGEFAGDFIKVLKNGKEFGIKKLHYAFQEGNTGIAAALDLAADFADGEPVTVILGDNVTSADISKQVSSFEHGASVFLKSVKDPNRFGCPVFGKDGKILAIEEKSKTPASNFAVTGIYIYDAKVFDYIKDLKPSGRGELEITDINNRYLKDDELNWFPLNAEWFDCGLPSTLFKASQFWYEKKRTADLFNKFTIGKQ